MPWIVQACGFSTASAVGLRRGFHVSTSLWSFACKERDPSRRADIAMESGCKVCVTKYRHSLLIAIKNRPGMKKKQRCGTEIAPRFLVTKVTTDDSAQIDLCCMILKV